MSRYLADTHVALWLWDCPEKLTQPQINILTSSATVYVSVASIWEIAIKTSLGKLNPPLLIADTFEECGFTLLPISAPHAEFLKILPFPAAHRDPFDRMLIAQATVERLDILTSDRAFDQYDVGIV